MKKSLLFVLFLSFASIAGSEINPVLNLKIDLTNCHDLIGMREMFGLSGITDWNKADTPLKFEQAATKIYNQVLNFYIYQKDNSDKEIEFDKDIAIDIFSQLKKLFSSAPETHVICNIIKQITEMLDNDLTSYKVNLINKYSKLENYLNNEKLFYLFYISLTKSQLNHSINVIISHIYRNDNLIFSDDLNLLINELNDLIKNLEIENNFTKSLMVFLQAKNNQSN